MNNYKKLIMDTFTAVIEGRNYEPALISQYFSKDYRQYVDGKELDFEGFCKHMKAQKLAIKQASVDFKTIVQEENTVFTNHTVEMLTNEERQAVIHVIAEFRIHEGKIIYCNELTRLVSGNESERDLGSRS